MKSKLVLSGSWTGIVKGLTHRLAVFLYSTSGLFRYNVHMERDQVLDILRKFKNKNGGKFHIKDIGIFGSVARGENTGSSDLDVIVRLEKPDLFSMVHIKTTIEQEIGCEVDLVRYQTHMNPLLKEQIEKEAVFV